MIERLEIENYKSLHKVQLDLPPFAVFVGANAAGKSNFADAFDFLSIVGRTGLATAVSNKGGYENICFRRARRAKGPIRFTLSVVLPVQRQSRDTYELGFRYSFAFRAVGEAIGAQYAVEHECLRMSCLHKESGEQWPETLLYERRSNAELVRASHQGDLGPFVPPTDLLAQVFDQYEEAQLHEELLLATRLRGLPPFAFLADYLSGLRVFQIMPPDARRPGSTSGNREMGKHGENLPAALQRLERESSQAHQELLEHLQLAVPTVEAVELDYVDTRELGLFLRERGIGRKIYASELSDGTLRTIALFLPLVERDYRLVVIEEPENCTHPWVARQFVEACRHHSAAKQILLTTHSPVVVDELQVDELFVVDRQSGQTTVLPATTKEDVVEVVRNGIMRLGEYWDSGAMGAVPEQPPLFESTE